MYDVYLLSFQRLFDCCQSRFYLDALLVFCMKRSKTWTTEECQKYTRSVFIFCKGCRSSPRTPGNFNFFLILRDSSILPYKIWVIAMYFILIVWTVETYTLSYKCMYNVSKLMNMNKIYTEWNDCNEYVVCNIWEWKCIMYACILYEWKSILSRFQF